MTVATALRRTGTAAPTDPSILTWQAAYWASDPNWLHPSDGVEVDSWRDFSGQSRTLSQTLTQRPIFRSSVAMLNNQAAVEFDGINDRIKSAIFTKVNQPLTHVIVMNLSATTARWFDNGGEDSGSARNLWRHDSGSERLYAGSMVAAAASTLTGSRLGLAHFNGSSSWVWRNGTKGSNVNPGTYGCSGVSLGGSWDGAYAACSIAFYGLYAGDITADANWASFVSWASTTYGLTMA